MPTHGPQDGARTRSQGALVGLLVEQRVKFASLSRMYHSVQRLNEQTINVQVLKKREFLLSQLWAEIKTLHLEISIGVSADDKSREDYFSGDEYGTFEEIFLSCTDRISTLMDAVMVEESSTTTPPPAVAGGSSRSLPRITIPQFDGDLNSWECFQDLFKSIIVDDPGLSNVEKFYHLKTRLIGEALTVIQNIPVTDANFDNAWALVVSRYSNKHLSIFSQVSQLLSLPTVTSSKPQLLRSLIDRTRSILDALKRLGEPVDQWDTIIVVMTVLRLDRQTRHEWDNLTVVKDKFPSFKEFENFIIQRINSLTIAEFKPPSFEVKQADHAKVSNIKARYNAHASISQNVICIACNASHALSKCGKFKQLLPKERFLLARKHKICFNCLTAGHFPDKCSLKNNCVSCKRRHHVLLHDVFTASVNGTETAQFESSDFSNVHVGTQGSNVALHFAGHASGASSVLLATAFVRVSGPQGQSVMLRALIDQGSERSFISEAAVQSLQVPRQAFSAVVTGLGDQTSSIIKQVTRVKVASQYTEDEHVVVDALILKKLTSYTPVHAVDPRSHPKLRTLRFADPFVNSNQASIMIVLGADVYGEILRQGLVHIPGSLTAQNTIFGWILSGKMQTTPHNASSTSFTSHHVVSNEVLNDSLEKFWLVEEVPNVVHYKPDELACEKLFVATTTRDLAGRYCVSLPFKTEFPINIGDSYAIALRAYQRLERRLARDHILSEQYHAFLSSYLALGHMESYEPEENEQCCFIPHHPVLKDNKLRVVFNASCPTSNGCSINDCLHVGPKLQQELPAIMLRWRKNRWVFVTDITKMFRQINVKEAHTRYQMILWRPFQGADIQIYRLTTVTYGYGPAPFLSLRVIEQLALDEEARFPLAAAEIPRNLYVDDGLFGASTISDCLKLRNELIDLMSAGCLPLKKWSSNNPAILAGISPEDCEMDRPKSFQDDPKLKILGISWNPKSDCLFFPVSLENGTTITKRTVFSQIAKLFDPLGLVAPVVLMGKLLMQHLWRLGIEWDEILSPNLIDTWQKFYQELIQLSEIRIPRWLDNLPSSSVQLHGFCDASQDAYAAAVYLRVKTDDDISVHLLCAKTRVAPVKTYVSIPRLELCGAELLSRLLQWANSHLDFQDCKVFAWSDSYVTLHWIAEYPARWKVFVANRVSAIQSRSLNTFWRYVPTHDNPADIASRGSSTSDLRDSSLWWHGPQWLKDHEDSWPTVPVTIKMDVDLEYKAHSAHVVASEEWDLVFRYSDWGKLLRITVLVFRCVSRLRPKTVQPFHPIDSSHFSLARTFWYRYVQTRSFPSELAVLASAQALARSSKIVALDPFIDELGLIRVGGRLQNASVPQRKPIILSDHAITRKIIYHAHLRTLHGGAQLMLRILREEFWILRARNLVRGAIASCVICARHKATLCSQKMAPLPALRVTPAPPFASVGIDYAGPFFVRGFSGRGHQSRKAWVALFVCLRVKAIHLELVMDCSTPAFLAAFRRFCARRGVPSVVLSDNGTNFHGADKSIRQSFQKAIKDPAIETTLASEGITWRFIPPASPHFGGIWESGVKSMKHHLRRVVSDHTLTLEEFQTLLCQIEACLNSRPLTPIGNDPSDLNVLTPGHFLIGRPLCAYPEPSLADEKESHLTRWQMVRRMRDHFWKAWRLDYLAELQKRNKWRNPYTNVKIGDIVIIHQENVPPAKWPLGKVIDCTFGSDGLTRVCRVQTAETVLLRSVHKLCVLPIELSSSLN